MACGSLGTNARGSARMADGAKLTAIDVEDWSIFSVLLIPSLPLGEALGRCISASQGLHCCILS